ncbi:MAG: recombination mediator RecR [Firmicutes bacterium]|nr:recombination mediator RecR [Bacillota bacterium]
MKNIDCIATLINHFTKLQGVGYKTAERFAYQIIESDMDFVKSFSNAMICAKENVKLCRTCGNFSVEENCGICERRADNKTICVVRDPRDAMAIEKSGAFVGKYHVLHGVISPLNKKGPNDLNLKSLITRVRDENIEEVIIATNPDVEGEATASYIAALIKPSGVKVTRLAQGLAMGAYIEYVDEVTIGAAISNRVII